MIWQQINGSSFSSKDKKELSKQVARFNNKLKRVSKKYENDDILLPNYLSTKELKKEIRTKRDLVNFYKEVNRFMEKEATIKTKIGNVQTILYEKEQIKRNTEKAKRQINKQLKEARKSMIEDSQSDFKKFIFSNDEIDKLEDTLSRLEIDKTKDIIDVDRLRKRSLRYSTESRIFRKMEIYKENYLKSLQEVFQYEKGYKLLRSKINKLSANKFYDLIKADKIASDIKAFYREKNNSKVGYGDVSGYWERIKNQWEKLLTE